MAFRRIAYVNKRQRKPAIESESGADPKISTVRRILAYLKITFKELYPVVEENTRDRED